MVRTTLWYLIGVACVLGLLVAIGIALFVVVFIFRNHLSWDWFVRPTLTEISYK
ncbi:MAG: hypothetical protein ACE5LU_10730 [Anaerolineae bacterium]